MDGFLEYYGYTGLIVFLILTGCGLPLPEEVGIIAAGILSAGDGPMDPILAYGACMVGALLGDSAMYGIGRFFGKRLMNSRGWLSSWLFNPEAEQRTERMIKNHGLKVFFAARFLVGVRGPMYLAAGVMHVPFRRFLFIDAICATCVVSTVFWLSYWFGAKFKHIWDWVHAEQVNLTIAVLVLFLIAGLVYWMLDRLKKKVAESDLPETEEGEESPLEGDTASQEEPFAKS